jgi:D-hexose-6-phosphate mutarotase
MSQLHDLQHRFASTDFLSFVELAPDFVALQVRTDHSAATIALQGAHVMTWQPNGQEPVIWLSPNAIYAAGKSIRGGIPLCWPWFGPHASEAGWPGHGFARTIPWQLDDARKLPDGRVRLTFSPQMNDAARAQWPHVSSVSYTVTIGQEFEVELATTNAGDTAFELGQALHTYFQVGDVRQASITGLAECEYIDKVDASQRKRQIGAVSFSGETDRVYLGTRGWSEIHDPVLQRTILITGTGSASTVVWNPWIEKANKMGDLGPEGQWHMLCVESANANDDTITLAPGETHRLSAQYRARAST